MVHFINQLFEFIIVSVVLKAIIAHWLAEKILHYSGIWFSKTERNMAIWTHYQMRAAGDGHRPNDILSCREGNCASL